MIPMRIRGIEKMTVEERLRAEDAGGRYVFYEFCISLIFITLRRPSPIYFLRGHELGLWRGLPYTLLSLLLGWWGVPWGFIYTPLVVVTNFSGGRDVTSQIQPLLPQRPDCP